MKDEIDSVPPEPDACEIKTPHDHQVMIMTLENPLRRKIVKTMGSFGKTKKEIMDELNISGSQLQFQIGIGLLTVKSGING